MTGEIILSAIAAFFKKGGGMKERRVTPSAKTFFQDSARARETFIQGDPPRQIVRTPPSNGELRWDPPVAPPTNTKFTFFRKK